MEWFIYAFITAILLAAVTVVQKKVLLKEHAMEFAATLAIVILIISLPFFLVINYSLLRLDSMGYLFLDGLLVASALLFVAKAVRHLDVSDSSPLLVLGPAVTAFIAFVFLGEILTIIQIGGVFLLILGAFILETKKHQSLLEPFKVFKESKYIRYIFLALVFFGLAATIDRLLLASYNMQPEAYIAFIHLFIAIDYLILLTVFHDGLKGIKKGMDKVGKWLFLVAVLTLGYRLAQVQAIALVNVGLVSAIKRSSALFTILIGGELFHEKNLVRKTIACLIMISGSLMIVL